MMTFLTVWFLGIIITAGLVFLVCRGEEVKYKELGIIAFMLVVWPIGLPCILVACIQEWFENSSKMDEVAFKIPGGKK